MFSTQESGNEHNGLEIENSVQSNFQCLYVTVKIKFRIVNFKLILLDMNSNISLQGHWLKICICKRYLFSLCKCNLVRMADKCISKPFALNNVQTCSRRQPSYRIEISANIHLTSVCISTRNDINFRYITTSNLYCLQCHLSCNYLNHNHWQQNWDIYSIIIYIPSRGSVFYARIWFSYIFQLAVN